MPRTDAQSILDHLTTGALLLDDFLRLQYINSAAEMMLGISTKQFTGLALRRFVQCTDGTLEERLFPNLLTCRTYTDREVKLILVNGKTITVNCTVTPIVDPPLAPAALLELVQIDRQLRISHEELQMRHHQASRDMIRGLAHEIKNPLGGVRGAAQLLESELGNPELREYTQVIIGEADRLRNLVDRLLGPNDRHPSQRFDFHTVFEHVRSLLIAESPAGVDIRTDYDPSIPPVEGDREMLIQATLNVARNALQVLRGKGEITLRTRILRKHNIGRKRHRLVLKADIIDNGPGIPRALRDRIFYPLVTSRQEGSGLGLPIAQDLVNRHHGLIEWESRAGRTEFSILLPVNHD